MNTEQFIERLAKAAMEMAINSAISYNDLEEMAQILYAGIFSQKECSVLCYQARYLRREHGLVRFLGENFTIPVDNFDQVCS